MAETWCKKGPRPSTLCVDVVKLSGERFKVTFRDPKPTVFLFKEMFLLEGLEGNDLSHNNKILSDEGLMFDGMVVEIVKKRRSEGLTPPCCC